MIKIPATATITATIATPLFTEIAATAPPFCGFTGPAIAERLFISKNSIRTHNKRIYTKLDVHKKTELLELIESYLP